MRHFFCVLALAALSALTACSNAAHDPALTQTSAEVTRAGDIVVSGAWSRPTQRGASGGHAGHAGHSNQVGAGATGVVYLRIDNEGAREARLIDASGSCCASITPHATELRDGLFVMTELTDGIVISPSSSVELKPAGLHLMLNDVKPDLGAGQRFSITLRFSDGLTLTVPVDVQPN